MQENICGYCQKTANFLCVRCSTEYYCSKKCQVTAFPLHRKECFSIPPLKPLNGDQTLSRKTSNNSLESDDSDKNSLAGLKKSEVETKTVALQKEPAKIEHTTEEIKENLQEVPKKIETKELVTPAFNSGIRTIPPNDYKKTPSVVSIPKQAVEQEKVVEEAVKPVEKSQGFSMETIRRNQQSSLMNQQQKKQPPKETRLFLKDLKVRQLPIGKVRVKIVGEYECPKAFYVTEALPAVDAFLEHIEVNIADFVKNEKTKSYKPVMNEVVLARFEGVYYRAVIESVINDDPSKPVYGVFFIDYGNVSQVTEDELLPFCSKVKGEIILHPVLFANFPSTITKALEEIVSSPDGFDVIVKEKSDKCYIADIVGI
ncbi:uncharacterized protein Veneno [Chironomus tepperi]|uniref:uncharacterized protein Veneno n=1 Tax=Chironomus tepperi TaxID=113505 RepID=UPI00391F4D8E